MQAKNGELAIARFDNTKHVCFVTGRDKSQTKFVYWEYHPNGTFMYSDSLPKGRVVSAAPKPGKELLFLGGEFCKLTMDDVVPATKENMAALCLSFEVDTAKVQLGGCYHEGKAYCLGYRTGHGEEVELCGEVFTNLNTGIGTRADNALKEHRENFDCTTDTPRFIVELAAVRIIDEDTDDAYDIKKDYGSFANSHPITETTEDCECGSHPDDCSCDGGLDDLDDYCFNCGENDSDCLCYENDDYCDDCDKFGCICDESFCCDCGEQQEECTCEDAYDCDDDLDDENVDQTFRPMNAFARARWSKACSR